jgi:hypothetical protein
MFTRWRSLSLVCVLAALGALVGADAPSSQEEALRRLEELRGQPAAYERMRKDLAAFYELPPERRDELRRLHQSIQDKDLPTRLELLEGLERYADWRERLSEEERAQIDSAPSKADRLNVIRRLREDQWIRTLPSRQRDELASLTGTERAARIAQLRREEWEQSHKPIWRGPTRLQDYPEDVREFFDNHLSRRLTPDERKQLNAAEEKGDGPTLARLLLDLAEKHPHLLQAVNHKPTPPVPGPHWASRPDEFPREVQLFLRTDLIPRLSEPDRNKLKEAEGKGMAYGLQLHKLARQYHLLIPGMSLPLTGEMLESWSDAPELPDVPARVLRQFALAELTPQERAALNLDARDPKSISRLRMEYDRRKMGPGDARRKGFPPMVPPR